MQPVVFDRAWFARHQAALLWLLRWRLFRWALCIHEARSIVAILPHAYAVRNENGTYTADFRTHAKYAKRLYYAFRPLWWICHGWDLLVANRIDPAWNLGFDTLTVYPDAGDPGTTSCDGTIRVDSVDELFAAIIAEATGSTVTQTSVNILALLRGSATSDQYQRLDRTFLLFDTSPLGASASVSAAVLSLFGTGKANALGDSDFHITACSPASNVTLTTVDFDQVSATSFGSLSYAAFDAGFVYNDFTLNASGRAAISLTGISKFAWRLVWDQASSFTGVWASNAITDGQASGSDESGSTQDPKLVVTYSAPNMTFILIPD
jgi:predicted nucleic acid-binding protein